jgi:hypothetical protein
VSAIRRLDEELHSRGTATIRPIAIREAMLQSLVRTRQHRTDEVTVRRPETGSWRKLNLTLKQADNIVSPLQAGIMDRTKTGTWRQGR